MMVTEKRKQEILENRRTFQRLNREIVEGELRKEVIVVTSRNGKQREITVHALTELDIGRAAEAVGLSLQDLLKKPDDTGTDEKGLAKMRFVDEIVSIALVGVESERLTAKELAANLPTSERTRVFARVLEISGTGVKEKADVEKFQPEPPGRTTSDANL